MTKEFICIICPASCHLTVSEEGEKICVKGNDCRRGEEHGIQEFREPLRMLTTTVALRAGIIPRLPVTSTNEIPRAKLGECLDLLYKKEVSAPLQCGELIVGNICNTGADIVASRSINHK